MNRIPHHNGVITYTFESFTSLPVSAHVSTRHGGVSPAPWRSLNFSYSSGDARERVQENFARFCTALNQDPSQPVRTHQIHSTGIAKVDWEDAGCRQPQTDALITDAVGLPLFLVFADCVPLVLYDPVHHALGACHAGWRGTINGMAAATLWAMQAAYSTDPAQVRVGIGPSIGPESYEVGEDVWKMALAKLPAADLFFRHLNGPTMPISADGGPFTPNGLAKADGSHARFNEKANPYFDLWQANAAQLISAAVRPAHIEIAGIDTAQNTDDFYSYRAQQGACGLFGLLTWLEPNCSG